MLNLTDIAQRIAQPHLCKSEDAEDLRLLCEKYPYSQVFPLLYLTVLAHSNDVHFDQELNKQAYKISDRTRLYELISGKDERREKEEVNGESEEGTKIEVEVEIVEEKEEKKSRESGGEEANVNAAAEKVSEIEETLTSNIQLPISKIDEEISTIKSKIDESNIEVNAFQDEITAQTIAASYSLEHEELKEKTGNILDEGKNEKKKGAEIEETLISNIQHPISPIEEIIPSSFEKSVEIESKKSFSNWLHANDNYTETKVEKINVDDLISKFIEDSPKISQPNEKLFEGRTEKKEFFSPTKKAKESLSEHQLPVSETLAKIFAAQGNFPKAIYAYEQLMLIIPEKKIFFANQIKELQKKLNQ